jgi:CHAT domain-containing protein/Flp pilus assembly protein TadD
MFFQRWFGHNSQSQSVAPSPKNHGLSDGDYESLFIQLLEDVHQGWSRGKIKGFLVAKGTTEAQFVAWLQGFGKRLLESSESNEELARCMVQLGEVGCGEVGEIAQDFGNKLLARNGGQDSSLINPNQSQNSSQPAATEALNLEAKVYFGQAIQQEMEGNFLGALASYDQALHFKPDDHKAWGNRGLVLKNLGRYEEAIASFEKTLQFQPNDHIAWLCRGAVLCDCLGRYGKAIASFDQALHSKPDYHEAWCNRGFALVNLGRYEEAIASFDQTVHIKPDYYYAWLSRGIGLVNLGRYEEAIASFDQALHIKPDFDLAWSNRGNALYHLGRYEQAIASYDQALHIKPDDHLVWKNRGIAAGKSVSCDPFLASQSSIARQHPALNQRGYDGSLSSYEQGLIYCPQDTHPEGWGLLHQAIGNTHYVRGRKDSRPRSYYYKAVKGYKEALKTLTAQAFPEAHLEVLQDLLRVYSHLGDTQKVEVLLGEGTELLGRLVQEAATDREKIRLSRKFAAFDQWRVDAIAQSGNWCAALELAEQRKNLYLGWLHYGCSEFVADSLNYTQMQELLQPSPTGKNASICHSEHSASEGKNLRDASLHSVSLSMTEQHDVSDTAIIYWHISPAAITTFILRYNQPPVVVSGKNDLTPPTPLPYQGMGEKNCSPLLVGEGQGERFFYPPSLRQLIDFENWIETWKKDYQNNPQTRWREEMSQRLNQLAKILNIEGILQHLKQVNQLILIPHRDLHLLPLDALFNLPTIEGEAQKVRENFTITYLPSIKVGLDRKKAKQNPHPRQPKISLFSVENPTDDLKFASLESELVSKLYPNPHTLSKSQATLTAVKETLSQGVDVFHFIGHSEHNLDHPEQSALILANKERLTVQDIFKLDLNGCNLVCLVGCETHLTNNFGLIDEFVGLASSFLAVGAMNVIGSLWPINDLASAYLMTQFHKILIDSEYRDVATALKQAQHLLRNVTNKQLQEWAEQLPVDCSQYRSLRIPTATINDNDKPFESPFYWAAFCAIGL